MLTGSFFHSFALHQWHLLKMNKTCSNFISLEHEKNTHWNTYERKLDCWFNKKCESILHAMQCRCLIWYDGCGCEEYKSSLLFQSVSFSWAKCVVFKFCKTIFTENWTWEFLQSCKILCRYKFVSNFKLHFLDLALLLHSQRGNVSST